jgi:hypothetical protein
MIIVICILLLLFVFAVLAFSYRKPISIVRLSNNQYDIFCCKPSKKLFRSLSGGAPYGFVHLGSGYYAFYSTIGNNSEYHFNDVHFFSDVYIFYRKGLKFKSVDLSDRCLISILDKFN